MSVSMAKAIDMSIIIITDMPMAKAIDMSIIIITDMPMAKAIDMSIIIIITYQMFGDGLPQAPSSVRPLSSTNDRPHYRTQLHVLEIK